MEGRDARSGWGQEGGAGQRLAQPRVLFLRKDIDSAAAKPQAPVITIMPLPSLEPPLSLGPPASLMHPWFTGQNGKNVDLCTKINHC